LGSDVVSTNASLIFAGSVTLDSTGVPTIRSGGGVNDNISLLSTVTSNNGESLILDAGTDGSIQVTGAVNLGTGNLEIDDAVNAFFSNQITAGKFTQHAGSGSTTLMEVDLSDNFAFTGQGLTLNSWVDTEGSMTVTNAGGFVSYGGGDITADLGFTQDGKG